MFVKIQPNGTIIAVKDATTLDELTGQYQKQLDSMKASRDQDGQNIDEQIKALKADKSKNPEKDVILAELKLKKKQNDDAIAELAAKDFYKEPFFELELKPLGNQA